MDEEQSLDIDEGKDESKPHGGEAAERIKGEEGSQVIRKMVDPRLPTQKEVDEHNFTTSAI